MILYDYNKKPIDKLYFNDPKRILMGLQNTIIDLINYKPYYNINDYTNLGLLHENNSIIKDEFSANSTELSKLYFHDIDVWFDKNENYFFYRCIDFPYTKNLLSQIPCIVENSAIFAVMVGPHVIPPHKAEMNYYLRYQLTVINTDQGDKQSWLEMGNDNYYHEEGDSIIFDHSRNHSVYKHNTGVRVVLIADIKRFNN